jgi:hypothetical protein
MALPTWLARFNRRWLNPRAVMRGNWPVLVHAGRNSGTTYRTPLEAYPLADGDGYAFTVNYGSKSDWPRNVIAAGSATLEIDGESLELRNPRMLPVGEAYPLLANDAKTPPGFVGVEQCLVVSLASVRSS